MAAAGPAQRLRIEAARRQLPPTLLSGRGERRDARDEAERNLSAWKLVSQVLDAKAATNRLAGLTERLDAAGKETATLRAGEHRHRHDLARLLTDHRDSAARQLSTAKQRLAAAKTAQETLDKELQAVLAANATAVEQAHQARSQIAEAEQTIAEAVEAGLIVEGADPAARDGFLAEQVATARRARTAAEEALEGISEQMGAEQRSLSAAQQRAASARSDAAEAERQLRDITRRVQALSRDQRLLDVSRRRVQDLWTGRTALTARCRAHRPTRHRVADARAAVGAAQSTVEAVRSRRVVASITGRRGRRGAMPEWRYPPGLVGGGGGHDDAGGCAAFAAARPRSPRGSLSPNPIWSRALSTWWEWGH